MERMPEGIGSSTSAEADKASKTVLLVASRQAMYQSLAHAFEQHFQSYRVVLTEDVRDLCPDEDTGLILISVKGADPQKLGSAIDALRREAPGIPIGLLVSEDWHPIDLRLTARVEGILPLWLPLEVLMAIASLLAAGGHYAPQASRQRAESAVAETAPPATMSEPQPELSAARMEPEGRALTAREEQILRYVSEGYQNKLIANRMALSEHTVKAHVHKVIAKLGVSNRTQAAAAFLRRSKTTSSGIVLS